MIYDVVMQITNFIQIQAEVLLKLQSSDLLQRTFVLLEIGIINI